jgi:hypothetical protein
MPGKCFLGYGSFPKFAAPKWCPSVNEILHPPPMFLLSAPHSSGWLNKTNYLPLKIVSQHPQWHLSRLILFLFGTQIYLDITELEKKCMKYMCIPYNGHFTHVYE